MSLFNPNYLQQSLILAGSLSLYSGLAQAQTIPASAVPSASASVMDNPEGRAGIATLCIEKRSYVDYDAKKIVTPTIYIDTMPKEGINTGYVEGNAIARQWEDFLNPKDEARKKWLEDTDIPDQAEAAIKLVKRLDKNKDGIVTPEEFEAGEQGASPEDRKIDLAFLTSLRCDNLFFTEGPKNKVDVDAFPEVVTLKGDLSSARSTYANLVKTHGETVSALEAEKNKSKQFLYATIGLGGLSVLLGVGLVVALRRKKSAATPPPLPKAPSKPESEKKPGSKVEVTVKTDGPAETQVKTSGGYDDVMKSLETDASKDAVDPAVLAALGEDTPETPKENEAPKTDDKKDEAPAKA